MNRKKERRKGKRKGIDEQIKVEEGRRREVIREWTSWKSLESHWRPRQTRVARDNRARWEEYTQEREISKTRWIERSTIDKTRVKDLDESVENWWRSIQSKSERAGLASPKAPRYQRLDSTLTPKTTFLARKQNSWTLLQASIHACMHACFNKAWSLSNAFEPVSRLARAVQRKRLLWGRRFLFKHALSRAQAFAPKHNPGRRQLGSTFALKMFSRQGITGLATRVSLGFRKIYFSRPGRCQPATLCRHQAIIHRCPSLWIE